MDDDEKYPSQLAERFQVRLPDGMRDKIKAAAEKNNRSMNAEIVARLEGAEITIRDQFAIAAMQALQARYFDLFDKGQNDFSDADLAAEAYMLADAMLAARRTDREASL